jgi:hypothetical protein
MTIFLYIGSGLTILWGISHLFPTKSVVNGFGDISKDNRHIITMEWIIEGVSLIFIGVLVLVVTIINPYTQVSNAVYITSSIGLIVLAVVSLFTGFKVNFFPFKICPLILTVSSVFILIGALT